jgi:hypothetical protein
MPENEKPTEAEQLIEALETVDIVSVVQRDGEPQFVDYADGDRAISMLSKALIQVVLDEIGFWDDEDDDLDEDGASTDEGGDPIP